MVDGNHKEGYKNINCIPNERRDQLLHIEENAILTDRFYYVSRDKIKTKYFIVN